MEGQFKDNINNFLKYNAFWIALAVVILIILVALIIILANRKKISQKGKQTIVEQDSQVWLNALGGQDNIIDAVAKGSRLTVKLVDYSLIDNDKLKQLGVNSIVKMSDKYILVVEKQAEVILDKIIKK